MNSTIDDNEIRVIGSQPVKKKKKKLWIIVAAIFAVVSCALLAIAFSHNRGKNENAQMVDTHEETPQGWTLNTAIDDETSSSIKHIQITQDSILLHIYQPVATVAELCLGIPDTNDTGILMAVQAADLRRDNGRIVGAFVLHGEPLSWGLSKRGYCAVIDGEITVGVAANSPLFEQATESGGDFFRQYPAVDNGQVVENNPENSAYRRALCMKDGHVCVVCSDSRMTMNDFSATLTRCGVQNAIFLVGGSAGGWVRTGEGLQHIGMPAPKKNKYINYLVFRAQ